ncbi:hypothetical protein AVEN_147553-1 [Araneus ventricosus]|uniref:Uncharacterized protein n=1 Tax=Araneus ventricosus TaxID=182803 RepID=A0A4Y2VBQ8_ARAVE|nr:hypothetical protein AVEN_147553-1 [Araneus ventricosus]
MRRMGPHASPMLPESVQVIGERPMFSHKLGDLARPILCNQADFRDDFVPPTSQQTNQNHPTGAITGTSRQAKSNQQQRTSRQAKSQQAASRSPSNP